MSYKALYRTYRPQIFADVTGQDVVVKTLQNAIKNNKISHAYLFSGPRGTGKTSVARIFAKALNCSDLQVNEPCDKCVSCNEISLGTNPDVIEIDAASNNGVDEIRDIREKVKFLPSGSKYKVYIIDEVHMLSGGAFNALLKTLEEPPKHAIFILATTEPQKLPATIISRCQRYEFKALSVEEISGRVKQICDLENVNITSEALNVISESAEGAMRDALSMLDQAISYGNKEIGIDDITGVTGSLSFDKVIDLATGIENKDVHHTLEVFNDLISDGKEVNKIINSLLIFYRDTLLYKSVSENGFFKYIFSKEEFQKFATDITIQKIMYFIDTLCDIQNKVRYSTTPNIFLEITLIKMCNVSVEDLDLIKRIATLEEKINNIGNVEISSNSSVVDNEKVNSLELRINQIVNELNRLELRKQIEKIDELKGAVNNIINSSSDESNYEIKNELQYLRDKIDELDLFVNKEESVEENNFEQKLSELENKLSEKQTSVANDVNLKDIYNRINAIESRENKDVIINDDKYDSLEESISNILEDINTLKEMSINKENSNFDNRINTNDLSEIKDKLMFLEKRIYQIIAGELSTKKVIKKEHKKNNGQIMLFGDEILSVNDFEDSKEDYNFGDLQKNDNEVDMDNDLELNDIDAQDQEIVTEDSTNVDNIEIKNEFTNDVDELIFENETDSFSENDTENFEEVLVEKQEIFESKDDETGASETMEGLFEVKAQPIPSIVNKTSDEDTVSRYFDVDKGQEIIKKQNSTLVISEKSVSNDEGSVVTDIIALETEDEQKEQSIIDETKDNEEVEVQQQPIVKDKFSKYDIKDIEQILHDSRAVEARNDKVRIEQVWKKMTYGAKPEHLSVIETLQEGKIAVVGNKEFIIVFSNVSICNIVMRKKFKDIAIRVLYNLLGDTYDYVALPTDVWANKSIEYKQQYQIGIKYPTLKPLDIPGLEISNKDEYQTESEKAIDRTIQLFGAGNVEIE